MFSQIFVKIHAVLKKLYPWATYPLYHIAPCTHCPYGTYPHTPYPLYPIAHCPMGVRGDGPHGQWSYMGYGVLGEWAMGHMGNEYVIKEHTCCGYMSHVPLDPHLDPQQ